VRSSRGSRRAASLLALAFLVAGSAVPSAHRRDEYLQAARLGIDPGRVQVELDLTPGIAVAEAILADIDRNRDGSLSLQEQQAYGRLVLSALQLEVDGAALRPQLGNAEFPAADAVRRGEGTIRLQSTVTIPRLSSGFHQLSFRNQHHAEGSVYLANALVPESDQVEVMAQRRDPSQRELTIDFVTRGTPAASTGVLFSGGLAAAAVLLALALRASRSFR
jgi:hypothetical protein